GISISQLAVEAARQHRLAAQADYYPKLNSTFANLHFNKFLGQQIVLLRRNLALPLFDKDQTFVTVTAVQPLTPIFLVREVVKIARADERIAEAKANKTRVEVAGQVEKLYLGLLIAQQQQHSARLKVKTLENELQVASTTTPSPERQSQLLQANKT